MKVVLDVSYRYCNRAGLGRYIVQLEDHLRALTSADFDFSSIAWHREIFHPPSWQRSALLFARDFFWAGMVAPHLIRRLRPDVLHSTYGPLIDMPQGSPHVVSLHDLWPFRYPKRFAWYNREILLRRFRRLPQARKIICVSRFTADEALRLLPVKSQQLEVVYQGGGLESDPATSQPVQLALPEMPADPFFLYLGSIEPVKNLGLLIAAYDNSHQRGISLAPLVVVGHSLKKNQLLPKTDRIHYLGRLSDGQTDYLYRNALALVLPSQYEGFGMPILEAMSRGCPVICSRRSALPEVAGDAAHYAEQSPEDYARAMEEIQRDSSLRRALSQAGQVQARRFSWARCAQQTLEVYRAVANVS